MVTRQAYALKSRHGFGYQVIQDSRGIGPPVDVVAQHDNQLFAGLAAGIFSDQSLYYEDQVKTPVYVADSIDHIRPAAPPQPWPRRRMGPRWPHPRFKRRKQPSAPLTIP